MSLTSVGSALLGLGLILAILSFATPAVLAGSAALLWEGYLFYRAGQV